MLVRQLTAALLAALLAANASAGVTLSGAIQQIAPPFSVQQGAVENDDHGFVFAERQAYELPSSIQVNISSSGVFNEQVELTPATISAGTRVNSYLVHVDTTSARIFQGSLTFSEPILGIMALESQLQAGHAIVGASATVYPVNGSGDAVTASLDFAGGSQFSDTITVNGPANRVDFYVGSSSSSMYEHFRIITAATVVPEPTALALAGCGLAVIIARRKPRGVHLPLSTIRQSVHSPKLRFTS